MSLYRLTYSSQAVSTLQPQDLRDILDASQKNNPERGVTGLLCYSQPIFLQILEGDRRQVNDTYHHIVTDKRHHSPRIIECTPIKQRIFETWSMQAIALNNLSKEQIQSLVLKYSGSMTLNPDSMEPEQCLNFLIDIAKIYQLSDNFFVYL